MCVWRAQQSPIEHAWQHDIVGVERAPGHLAVGVNFGSWGANDLVGAGLLLVHVVLCTHDAPPTGRVTCSSDRVPTKGSGRVPARGTPTSLASVAGPTSALRLLVMRSAAASTAS